MNTIRYELDADGIATITFDAPDSPVNTMTAEWQADLAEAAAQLGRDKERIKGVLLASAKTTFFAGAALKTVMTLTEADAAPGFAGIEAMKASFRAIETLGRPVVALLNGAALGGGWEVALIGHARFALDDPKIRFGTPEVTLGLIPGATGITKTVRKLGLMAAQPYLLEGKLFGPREAVELGWVEALAATRRGAARRGARLDRRPSGREAAVGRKRLPDAGRHAVEPEDRRRPRGRAGDAGAEDARPLSGGRRRSSRRWSKARSSTTTPRPGSRAASSPRSWSAQTAKNMIQAFFFDLNAIKSGKSRPAGFPAWKPRKVGVLGAGMMGAGIAHANAARGIAVRAEGRLDREGRGRPGGGEEDHRAAGRQGADGPARGGEAARPDHADGRGRRARRLRADHRGGVREPRR